MQRTSIVWPDDQVALVDESIAAARAGTPTVLAIEGEPGQGKSELLREVLERATEFEVLDAAGDESTRHDPYSVLRRWGILSNDAAVHSPFQAAQHLRDLVGRLQLVGPVVLALDDLQWVDRESVESIVWLLRRATGDRLLVVAAYRPLRASAQPEWVRMLLDEHLPVLRLDGRALGRAPQFAALDRASLELLEAIAVLGTGWVPLTLAAELGRMPSGGASADPLVAAGLLEREGEGSASRVRITHALYSSAALEGMSPSQRQRLHLRAAELISSPAAALEHRVAAADGYDDALADDLEAFATTLHAAGVYRDAGRFLRLASAATSGPELRERRWLDALFGLLLARDLAEVIAELPEVSWAKDPVRRALVQGFQLVLETRWIEAHTVFATLDAAQIDAAEPLVRYRVLTLSGWTDISMGRPGEEVLPGLRAALALEPMDASVANYLALAYGQAQMRVARPGGLWGFEDTSDNPPQSAAAPPGGRLGWRGAVYAFSGREDEAVRDLTAYTDRIRDGRASLGDGAPHALLGLALWLRGDIRRAAVPIGIARDSRYGSGHPIVLAVEALPALADGDLPRAHTLIDASRELLRRAPWPQAITAALLVETLAMRLTGTADDRSRYLTHFRADFGSAPDRGLVAPLRLLHIGLAAAWAGEGDFALAQARDLQSVPLDLPWRDGAVGWIAGLVAARADGLDGVSRLQDAVQAGMHGLPIHSAILAADLVDAATDAREFSIAAAASSTSAAEFARLGLGQFAPRPESTAETNSVKRSAVWSQLSGREADVVALLVEGLSYAQIATELFLTRSTVAFHLSNAYAKTNTASRHELVSLIRAEREA